MKLFRIIRMVWEERQRQISKWGKYRNLPSRTWLAILMEEVGEIAKADLEHDRSNQIDEIIQVIAVCIAWLQDITT